MGVTRYYSMTISTALYFFAAGLALAAVASAEISNEESFAEATSFVQAFTSEQGGDSACRKVADDSIKTIKAECDALQKTVDEAAKANQACCKSGKEAVCANEKSKDALAGKKSTCDGEAKAIASAKITFTSSLKALKNGKCKSIHGSSAYKNKKAEHRTKTKECNKLSGAASEAKKALKAAIKAAKASRKKCNSDAKNALNKVFKTAKKACNSKKNKRAFTRAQHMKCVLDGKNLKRCNAGKAPAVTKSKMSKLTCGATTTCSSSSSSSSDDDKKEAKKDDKKEAKKGQLRDHKTCPRVPHKAAWGDTSKSCCDCKSDEYPGDWDNGQCCGHCTETCTKPTKGAKTKKDDKKKDKAPDGMHVCTCADTQGRCWEGDPEDGCCRGNVCMYKEQPPLLPGMEPPKRKVTFCKDPVPDKTGCKTQFPRL